MGSKKWQSESQTDSRHPVIDCHCHFDMMSSPEQYIAQMSRNGNTIIGMTNRPCHFRQGLPFIKKNSKIRLALGLHPLEAGHYENDIKDFEELIDKTSYIGEIGLDFSEEGRDTAEKQIDCFEEILRLLTGKKKILSVHSRQAEDAVLEMLELFYQENVIFHWYSGNEGLVPNILRLGYYFSINEAMTLNSHGRGIISAIPKDRVLTESDAPYNKRSDINQVIVYLSKLWNMTCDEVNAIINHNFMDLLKNL